MHNAYLSPFSFPVPAASTDRALALGGGGATGNAWMIGVLAGLLHEGVDAAAADLLIGTSAGATTAAQISFRSPAELFDSMRDTRAPGGRAAADPTGSVNGGTGGSGVAGAVAAQLERTSAIIAASTDAADMRRRMAASARALESADDESRHARWRRTVASRLPERRWPDRALRITAVDASDGSPFVFDRDSGVGLADAVAASCSSGAPHRIGERWFIDGGYLRNENADQAMGAARVLVLSPFGGRTRHPFTWRMQLSAQVEDLRELGSVVETIGPDGGAPAVIGANAMDPSLRPIAAQAGFEQGARIADRIARFWE